MDVVVVGHIEGLELMAMVEVMVGMGMDSAEVLTEILG